jgi:hypothetical protein
MSLRSLDEVIARKFPHPNPVELVACLTYAARHDRFQRLRRPTTRAHRIVGASHAHELRDQCTLGSAVAVRSRFTFRVPQMRTTGEGRLVALQGGSASETRGQPGSRLSRRPGLRWPGVGLWQESFSGLYATGTCQRHPRERSPGLASGRLQRRRYVRRAPSAGRSTGIALVDRL